MTKFAHKYIFIAFWKNSTIRLGSYLIIVEMSAVIPHTYHKLLVNWKKDTQLSETQKQNEGSSKSSIELDYNSKVCDSSTSSIA